MSGEAEGRPRRAAATGALLASPGGGTLTLRAFPGETITFTLYDHKVGDITNDGAVDSAVPAALKLLRDAFGSSQARDIACGVAGILRGGVLAFVSLNGHPVTAAACFLKKLPHNSSSFFPHVAFLTTAKVHRGRGFAALLLSCLTSSSLLAADAVGVGITTSVRLALFTTLFCSQNTFN
jgi:hypothetical protein